MGCRGGNKGSNKDNRSRSRSKDRGGGSGRAQAAEVNTKAVEVDMYTKATVGDQNKMFDPGGSVWGAVL